MLGKLLYSNILSAWRISDLSLTVVKSFRTLSGKCLFTCFRKSEKIIGKMGEKRSMRYVLFTKHGWQDFFLVKLVEEENMSREGNERKKRCLP